MKSLTGLKILAGLILVLEVAVTANNVTWGVGSINEMFLANKTVFLKDRWFTTHKVDVVFPPKGYFLPVTITRIVATDLGGKKNFGYARLTKGGIRQSNATVTLQSQRGKLLHYNVSFFGIRDWRVRY